MLPRLRGIKVRLRPVLIKTGVFALAFQWAYRRLSPGLEYCCAKLGIQARSGIFRIIKYHFIQEGMIKI
jgi:hypothetical protein